MWAVRSAPDTPAAQPVSSEEVAVSRAAPWLARLRFGLGLSSCSSVSEADASERDDSERDSEDDRLAVQRPSVTPLKRVRIADFTRDRPIQHGAGEKACEQPSTSRISETPGDGMRF